MRNTSTLASTIRLLSAGGLLLGCVCAQAELSATRITAENAAQLNPMGPDAVGGIGDWHISNGTLCAVVSDVEHEGQFSSTGGTLVDLGFCGRADDHHTSSQDILGSLDKAIHGHAVSFEQGDGWVSVVTQGSNNGVSVDTRFTFKENAPNQLFISKRVSVVADDHIEFNTYSPMWFNYHSLEPFVFSSQQPADNRGFNNVDFVSRGSKAIREAPHNGDTVILSSPPEAEFPISYGWQLKSARRVEGAKAYDVPAFVVTDEETTIFLILADSFYLGDGKQIGLLQLPQIPFLSMDKGDVLELEEVIHVGDRADVASITDQFFGQLADGSGLVLGRVAEPDSAIHVMQEGMPITFVRPELDGSFEFRVPHGEYQLRLVGSAGREQTYPLTIESKQTNIGTIILPPAALLNLPRGQAMRLVFKGMDGTEDPDFDDRLTDFSTSEGEQRVYRAKVSQLFLAGVESDPATVAMAPGRYQVYATRGPEYSLSSAQVTIVAGKQTALEIAIPQQVIKTPGYIAADLHVHSGLSFDNTLATDMRVRTFVAEHGEVMVSSEHDLPTDYSPMIEKLGVQDQITSINAMEMTSLQPSPVNPYTGGHINFFPFDPRPLEYRDGMIKHEDRRLRDILHEARVRQPNVIAQLNHGRTNMALSGELPENYQELIKTGQYLEHMGVAAKPYNPNYPLSHEHNHSLIEAHPKTGVRDIDFDAMEIVNPGEQYHQQRIAALRKDWLSFLRQGLRITATANSDSHHANEQVAVPRNMVAVQGDSIASFDQAEFLSAIKQGRLYGTTGPMLEVDLSGAKMGDTFAGPKGVLNIKLSSADWIPVDRLRVLANGETLGELAVEGETEFQFEIATDEDMFIIVEVFGEASQAYAAVYPHITPYAFSNPIYIDHDADGRWQAPGLRAQ